MTNAKDWEKVRDEAAEKELVEAKAALREIKNTEHMPQCRLDTLRETVCHVEIASRALGLVD